MDTNKQKHGFKIPKGYFENFEENLSFKMQEENFPKSDAFKVPGNYFETLDERIISKVNSTKNETKIIPIYFKKSFQYAAAIAACLLIALLAIPSINNSNPNFESLSEASILEYIDDDNLELNLQDFAGTMDESTLSYINQELFSEENLESYLLDDVDEEFLIK